MSLALGFSVVLGRTNMCVAARRRHPLEDHHAHDPTEVTLDVPVPRNAIYIMQNCTKDITFVSCTIQFGTILYSARDPAGVELAEGADVEHGL